METPIWEILGFALLLLLICVSWAAHRMTRANSGALAPAEEPRSSDDILQICALEDRLALLFQENEYLRREIENLRRDVEALSSRGASLGDDTDTALIILGLDPASEPDHGQIRRAYISAVHRFHPDTGGSDTALRLVNRAYAMLGEMEVHPGEAT